MLKPRTWDRHSIRAEVHRRGLTITGIALDAGLYKTACTQALRGGSYPGALAISRALGVPVEELFPDCYLHHHRRNRSGKAAGIASQNAHPRADTQEAA